MYFSLSDLFNLLIGAVFEFRRMHVQKYSLFDFDIYVLVLEMNRTIIQQ